MPFSENRNLAVIFESVINVYVQVGGGHRRLFGRAFEWGGAASFEGFWRQGYVRLGFFLTRFDAIRVIFFIHHK